MLKTGVLKTQSRHIFALFGGPCSRDVLPYPGQMSTGARWLADFMISLNNKSVSACEPPAAITGTSVAEMLLKWLNSMGHIHTFVMNGDVANSVDWFDENKHVALWRPGMNRLRVCGARSTGVLHMCAALIRAGRVKWLELHRCTLAAGVDTQVLSDAIGASRLLTQVDLVMSSSLHPILSGVARCRSMRTLVLGTDAAQPMSQLDWSRLTPLAVYSPITTLQWEHSGALAYNPFSHLPAPPLLLLLLPNLCRLWLKFDATLAASGEVYRTFTGVCGRVTTLDTLDMSQVTGFSVDQKSPPLQLPYPPSTGKQLRIICPSDAPTIPTGSQTVYVHPPLPAMVKVAEALPHPPAQQQQPLPAVATAAVPSPPTHSAPSPTHATKPAFAYPVVRGCEEIESMWNFYEVELHSAELSAGRRFTVPTLPTGQPLYLISLARLRAMPDAHREELRVLLQVPRGLDTGMANLLLTPEAPVLLTAAPQKTEEDTRRYWRTYPLTVHPSELAAQKVQSTIAGGQGNAVVVNIGALKLFQKKLSLKEEDPRSSLLTDWRSYLNEYRAGRMLPRCRYFPAMDKHSSFVSHGVGYLSAELIDSKQCISLHSVLRAGFSAAALSYFYADLAYAIHAIHSHGLEHNDMHSRNVMCHYLRGTCTVVDFGMCTRGGWLDAVLSEFVLPSEFGARGEINRTHISSDGYMCDVHRALFDVMSPSMVAYHGVAKIVSHLLVSITDKPLRFRSYITACEELKELSDMARAKFPGSMPDADAAYRQASDRMLRPRWAVMSAYCDWQSMIDYQPPAVYPEEKNNSCALAKADIEYLSDVLDAWFVSARRTSTGEASFSYNKPVTSPRQTISPLLYKRMSEGVLHVPTHGDYHDRPLPISPSSELKLPSSSSSSSSTTTTRLYQTHCLLTRSSSSPSSFQSRAFTTKEEMRTAAFAEMDQKENVQCMTHLRSIYDLYRMKDNPIRTYYQREANGEHGAKSAEAYIPFMYRLSPNGHFPFLPNRYNGSYFTEFGQYLAELRFLVAVHGLPGFEQLQYASMSALGVGSVRVIKSPANSRSLYRYLSACIDDSRGISRGFQRFLAAQLAYLAQIMHRRQIIHANLTLANLMFSEESKELTIVGGQDSYTRHQEETTVRVFGREWSKELQHVSGVWVDYFTPLAEMLEFGYSEFAIELMRHLPFRDKTGLSDQINKLSSSGSSAAFEDCRRIAKQISHLTRGWRDHMAKMSFIHQMKMRYALCTNINYMVRVSNAPLALSASDLKTDT